MNFGCERPDYIDMDAENEEALIKEFGEKIGDNKFLKLIEEQNIEQTNYGVETAHDISRKVYTVMDGKKAFEATISLDKETARGDSDRGKWEAIE